MNNLTTFNFESREVRSLLINDEPYFVGKDVANILGYSNSKDAIRKHVDEEDKAILQRSQNATLDIPNRGLSVINESGLYSLILSSKLPSAKRFKRWVTSEVLPQIRKTGKYANTPKSFAEALRLAADLEEEKEKLMIANKTLEDRIEQDRPKTLFADAVSQSHSTILVRELSKLLNQNGIKIGQNRLFTWLREHGYLIKSGRDKNTPTQRSMDLGLFKIKEGSYINGNGQNVTTKTTLVTGKGQIYFINKFLNS